LTKHIKIGHKITALLLGVVLTSILVFSYVSYQWGKEGIEQKYWEKLAVFRELKTHQIEGVFEKIEENLFILKKMPGIRQSIHEYQNITHAEVSADSLLTIYQKVKTKLDTHILPFENEYQYKNITVLSIDRKTIYQVGIGNDKVFIGQKNPVFDNLISQVRNKKIYYSHITKSREGISQMHIVAPVFDNPTSTSNKIELGYIIITFDISPIQTLLLQTEEIGEDGEVLLGKLDGSNIFFLNKRYFGKVINESTSNKAQLLREVLNEHQKGQKIATWDKRFYLNWVYLPQMNWALAVKMSAKYPENEENKLLLSYAISGLAILILSFFVSIMFVRFTTTNPLDRLNKILHVVAQGKLPNIIERKSNDELGDMTSSLNYLVQALKRNAHFAYRIGDKDFKADFEPISKDDMLGNALLTMRDSIQSTDIKERERAWIMQGVAEMGEVLRDNHDDINTLAEQVSQYMAKKINAVQGAFYVVEKYEIEALLEIKASYAYNKKKYLKGKFRFSEGLIGQAAIEKSVILRTEIPDNFVFISSGLLGDAKPTCLLIVPLMTQNEEGEEEVYGVLEFAGFERFKEMEISFAEEVAVIIARTIANIKVSEKTKNLLLESQEMSQKLQHQKGVLQQNAQEMEETQAKLQNSYLSLEEKVLELNQSQKRTQALLENASEIITIYELEGQIRYISPSVEAILGYQQEEMIGINDNLVHVYKESREQFSQMFNKLINNPDEKLSIQVKYKRKSGRYIWLEATGVNRLQDPAVKGIVVNYRDITEELRAEKEERMRGQMQALSENSPDLIMRLNLKGEVFYVNAVIKSLTGLRPEHFLGKKLVKAGLAHDFVTNFIEMMTQAIDGKYKITKEMNFNSINGMRIMEINAIPEYNQLETLESVLIVAHDITEQKEIENEIRESNKKISESINYAQRIQNAILPDTSILQQNIPNSFIYYEPRDVVSGDFPWMMLKGDYLYLAVVDCTGHGVPGALISVIGYFLLNDIINSSPDGINAGQVLDALDLDVEATLHKNGRGSSTKDGMDIAFCRINLKTRVVDYSGAHRPLFILNKNGELKEIKGDRSPIGGGVQYKKHLNFTNTEFKVEEDDKLYFFSDGFTDQFGGPSNRKYGSRRIKDLIVKHKETNMPKMQNVFEDEYKNWKGSYKQTDDILVIGIKF
jgi:PAS domain S-box-containing protein